MMNVIYFCILHLSIKFRNIILYFSNKKYVITKMMEMAKSISYFNKRKRERQSEREKLENSKIESNQITSTSVCRINC